MSASIIGLQKEHPYERKVYRLRCSSSNDLGRGDGFDGQVNHGIHSGNKSVDDSRVLGRAAWNFIGHLRRRNLGGLVVRFTQTACSQRGGVQSTQERSAQPRQQE